MAGHVPQQRTLADARLTAQHRDTASAGEHFGDEAVEYLTFGTTPDEFMGIMTNLGFMTN
jgi:hypothetical protein